MSTTSKADLTAERMARRVCSRLVGWLSRRVDDVHSGDAGVGSREGDDAGQFVTVEYAKAWVAPDWTAFDRQFGQNLDKLDQSVLTAPADAGESGDVRAVCRCGCGGQIVAPRKFVNQDHYSAWLSAQRYMRRNRRQM